MLFACVLSVYSVPFILDWDLSYSFQLFLFQELASEIAELEKQRDDLEAQLKKVFHSVLFLIENHQSWYSVESLLYEWKTKMMTSTTTIFSFENSWKGNYDFFFLFFFVIIKRRRRRYLLPSSYIHWSLYPCWWQTFENMTWSGVG